MLVILILKNNNSKVNNYFNYRMYKWKLELCDGYFEQNVIFVALNRS